MVVIIDYKVGNPLALKKMIEKLGGEVVVSSDLDVISKAEKLILSGVGSFDSGVKKLQDNNLVNTLNDLVFRKKTPILGICLGMQLMALGSEEGCAEGLGWFPYRFKKFDSSLCKVPHMGWNYLSVNKCRALLSQSPEFGRYKMYFDHAYFLDDLDVDDAYISSTAYHGITFVSSLERDNIFATQFHPEKSLKYGMDLVRNFLEL